MLKSHTHVGCNVSEIQNQKDEHQAFQETAKVSKNNTKFPLLCLHFCVHAFICYFVLMKSFSHFPRTEHIQLWHSAIKCCICTPSIVQTQFR